MLLEELETQLSQLSKERSIKDEQVKKESQLKRGGSDIDLMDIKDKAPELKNGKKHKQENKKSNYVMFYR